MSVMTIEKELELLAKGICRNDGHDPEAIIAACPDEYDQPDGRMPDGKPGCYCWRRHIVHAMKLLEDAAGCQLLIDKTG